MCGIGGIVNKYNKRFPLESLIKMSKSMKLRGPDDYGYALFNKNESNSYIDESHPLKEELRASYNFYKILDKNSAQKYELGFCHRRLSIIDLSINGHQPISDRTNQFWLTYNGEIYNFKEIKKELKKLGYKFTSNSDSEVLLKSLIEWGKEAIKKFNGMFAFAFYDASEKTVLLVRDRLGIKPLYYINEDDYFIFASDQKSIINTNIYHPEIDMEGLYNNLSSGISPRPRTCFKEIRQLEPGTIIKYNLHSKSFIKEQYWDININPSNNNYKINNELEDLEKVIYSAVKYRLTSDQPIGSFMSGGIDSSTITAIANSINPEVLAFTLKYSSENNDYNEHLQAKKIAEFNNINHVIEQIDPNDTLRHIYDMVNCYEEPYYSLSPNYMINKLVKNYGVTVTLNGLGGDELFHGYSHYKYFNLWRKMKWFGKIVSPNDFVGDHLLNKKLEIISSKNIVDYYLSFYSTFTENEKQILFEDDVSAFNSSEYLNNNYSLGSKNFNSPLELLSYLDIKHYIGDHQLNRGDKFAMNFSIEGRFPFLDHNIVNYSFKMRNAIKIKLGTQKWILKELAKRYIPQDVIKMKKKGFQFPMNKWVKNNLKDFSVDNIKSLAKRDIFNKKTVNYILNNFENVSSRKLWHLVMVELWLQLFFDSTKKR